MLSQRRRRWPNVKPTLCRCFLFAGQRCEQNSLYVCSAVTCDLLVRLWVTRLTYDLYVVVTAWHTRQGFLTGVISLDTTWHGTLATMSTFLQAISTPTHDPHFPFLFTSFITKQLQGYAHIHIYKYKIIYRHWHMQYIHSNTFVGMVCIFILLLHISTIWRWPSIEPALG